MLPISTYGLNPALYTKGVAAAQIATTAQTAQAASGGFAASLANALGQSATESASATAGQYAASNRAASTGAINAGAATSAARTLKPLPARGLTGAYGAPKASGSGKLNPLQVPETLKKKWSTTPASGAAGQTSSSRDLDAVDMPDPYTTYGGGYFDLPLELGPAQLVGQEVFQFHFPHLVEKDGTYYAYFIDHSGGSENDVGLATSTDGVNFTYQGKVLGKGEDYDQLEASFPAVQYDQESGTWYMLYEAKANHDDLNSVCLATSADGYNWSKQGPVIEPGDAGKISEMDVGTPTMFKEGGVWNVYFHTTSNDGRVRIGYASGTDLNNLTVKQGSLIDVDAEGAESGTVGARSNVVKVGDLYYMAYEVSTAEPDFSQAKWGTNLARSTRPDGGWQKLEGGPLLENPSQGFGYDGPELSVQDGRVYLYYRTTANGTARRELTGLDGSLTHQAVTQRS